jgi:hypothetical protein
MEKSRGAKVDRARLSEQGRWRKFVHQPGHDWLSLRRAAAAGVALSTLLAAAVVLAQTTAGVPGTLPDTTIAPAGSERASTVPLGDTEGPDIDTPPEPATAHSPAAPLVAHRHAIHRSAADYTGPLEAGQAMLVLKTDSWAYTQPARSASHVERLQAGKYVKVTGATVHYLRVKLKSGATAYVPMTAVELARPTDKIFRLTKDTPVLSAPNHSSKRLAEVHDGHEVHVVGTSMNYMKIRMKDGLEGFITVSALE